MKKREWFIGKNDHAWKMESNDSSYCPFCGSHRVITHNPKYCDCYRNCKEQPFEYPTRCLDCEEWFDIKSALNSYEEWINISRTKLIDKMLC